MWDPNTWVIPETKTITLSNDGAIFTIVDADKYEELMELGPWHLYEYRTKQYARRTRRRGEWRQPHSIYMHTYLAKKYLRQPSPRHIIVDHKRSNGLDNRLKMIRWCTPRDNRLNIYGMWYQSDDFIGELNQIIKAGGSYHETAL